jgi:hypothetical protein
VGWGAHEMKPFVGWGAHEMKPFVGWGAHEPKIKSWAHLGSNQEQPGYEPGALTD